MSIAIPDPIRAVVDRLEADSTLAALVTAGSGVAVADAAKVRLYGGHLPQRPVMLTTIPNAIAPALVFAAAGGSGHRDIDALFYPRVEIRAYGPDDAPNAALWFAALDALRRMVRLQNNLWLEADLNATWPVSRREPNDGFRYHSGMIGMTAIAH